MRDAVQFMFGAFIGTIVGVCLMIAAGLIHERLAPQSAACKCGTGVNTGAVIGEVR